MSLSELFNYINGTFNEVEKKEATWVYKGMSYKVIYRKQNFMVDFEDSDILVECTYCSN